MTDAELEREALRLHLRYCEEIVEALDVCPWARRAREAGEWRRRVLTHDDAALEPSLRALEELAADPARPPVAIFIYPRLTLAPRAFDAFAARLREAEQHARGGRALYVAATFHPDYPFDARSAAALVPFLRRSPDPSIQWIRLEVVEQAREGHGKFLFDFSPAAWAELERRRDHPSVTDRIGADNQKRVADLGRDHFEAIYQAIRDDRARTYGATATSGGERRR